MKRLMILFGALDLITVLSFTGRFTGLLRSVGDQPWLLLLVLLLISLAFSGFGLMRGRTWALTLNYVQLPLRIAFAVLTLSWIARLILPPNPSQVLFQAVWLSIIALEGIRTGLTIMIHRTLRRETPATSSPLPAG